MNPQTRSMLKAAGIGLASSLALTGLLILGGQTQPVGPYSLRDAGAIGYWGGQIAALPIIFALGAIAFRFRTVPLWVSGLNFVGAFVGLPLICSLMVAAVVAAYPVPDFPFASAGADRDSFVKGAVARCVRSQRNQPENRGMADNVIEAFCRCFAEAMADLTKKEYVDDLRKNSSLPPETQWQLRTAADKCVRSARN